MTYAPGTSGNAFSLFWFRGGLFGSEGSMTITVDGGATLFSTPTSGGQVTSQTLSVAGAAGIQELVITVATAGVHTLTVTNGATLQIELVGVECYDTTAGSVLIRCLGSPGLTSTDLTVVSRRQSTWAMPCELSLLSVGINDWNTGVLVATYASNLATLNTDMTINSISDVMYWTPPPSDFNSVALAVQKPYVEAMRTAAGSTVVIADLWQRYVDFGGYAALGQAAAAYYNDALHPSALGNTDIARFLANVLMRDGR